MQDRLRDLGIQEEVPRKSHDEVGVDDIEMGEVNKDNEEDMSEKFMSEFFEEVNAIKSGMALIGKNIEKVDRMSKDAIVAVKLDPGTKSSEELERLIDETNLTAADVRNKLKNMDEENKKMANNKKKAGSAEYRIRSNMHQTLTKKFLDIMTEYQEVQTTYKNKYREKIERQYKIVKPNITQGEIDEAIETGNTQVFAQEILVDKRHTQAKEALQYIENRHKDILRLEQSIQELHQLFCDMAVLVDAQGELIDQIEHNVNQSVAYTKEGVKKLGDALKLNKKSRKKMCIIIIIVLIIFVLLIGGLGGILGGIFGGN